MIKREKVIEKKKDKVFVQLHSYNKKAKLYVNKFVLNIKV